MGTLTIAAINGMTGPQMRKAVKDLGEDPQAARFGRGKPELLKAFLLQNAEVVEAPPRAVVKQQPIATVRPAGVVAKPAARTIATVLQNKPVACVVAMTPKPVSAGGVAASKPTAVVKPAATMTSGITPNVEREIRSILETIELRVATLEQMQGVSNATAASEAPAVADYSCLSEFMVPDPDGGAAALTIQPSDVAALTEEQVNALNDALGNVVPQTDTIRVKKLAIVSALKQLAGETVAPKPTSAVAVAAAVPALARRRGRPPLASGLRLEGQDWDVGDLIAVRWTEEDGTDMIYDPCTVTKIDVKRGAFDGYTITFPDGQEGEIDANRVEGPAENAAAK